MKIHIMVMSGIEDGATIPLDSTAQQGISSDRLWQIRIGRGSGSEIGLRYDNFVSRPHAMLEYDAAADKWMLHDLDSRNGTFVQHEDAETRVDPALPAVMQPGRFFRVGRTWLRFGLTDEE